LALVNNIVLLKVKLFIEKRDPNFMNAWLFFINEDFINKFLFLRAFLEEK
jgi:hypothetical protein